MPYFRLETNVSQNKIPEDLPGKICEIISKSLGKPLDKTCATVVGDVKMSWGATNEPAAQGILQSIGKLSHEENKKHTKAFFELITKSLNVAPDRFTIRYFDLDGKNVGYDGDTVV